MKACKGCSSIMFLCFEYFYTYIVVYVCICLYIAYIHACVYIYTHIEMKYLWKHTEMIKHYVAVFHVPLDSDCCKLCLSFVLQSLLYSIYLALGTITEIPQTPFMNFVGGYFVVG